MLESENTKNDSRMKHIEEPGIAADVVCYREKHASYQPEGAKGSASIQVSQEIRRHTAAATRSNGYKLQGCQPSYHAITVIVSRVRPRPPYTLFILAGMLPVAGHHVATPRIKRRNHADTTLPSGLRRLVATVWCFNKASPPATSRSYQRERAPSKQQGMSNNRG